MQHESNEMMIYLAHGVLSNNIMDQPHLRFTAQSSSLTNPR
jgi:hypothetical protein